MTAQLFRTKNKFKGNKKFAAGYGAVKFTAGTNPAMMYMSVMRPLVEGGAMVDTGEVEAIPTSMVARLQKKLIAL